MEFKVILSDFNFLFLIALRIRAYRFLFFISSFSWTRRRFCATFKRTFTPSITMTVNKALFFSVHATNFYRSVCFIRNEFHLPENEIRYFIYIDYVCIYIYIFEHLWKIRRMRAICKNM